MSFELIEENMSKVNPLSTGFLTHKQYIKHSKRETQATNKLIKDIKQLGFGFRKLHQL